MLVSFSKPLCATEKGPEKDICPPKSLSALSISRSHHGPLKDFGIKSYICLRLFCYIIFAIFPVPRIHVAHLKDSSTWKPQIFALWQFDSGLSAKVWKKQLPTFCQAAAHYSIYSLECRDLSNQLQPFFKKISENITWFHSTNSEKCDFFLSFHCLSTVFPRFGRKNAEVAKDLKGLSSIRICQSIQRRCYSSFRPNDVKHLQRQVELCPKMTGFQYVVLDRLVIWVRNWYFPPVPSDSGTRKMDHPSLLANAISDATCLMRTSWNAVCIRCSSGKD